MLRKSTKQLTARFLQRTVLFLTAFSVGLALFFYFGNLQDFMDSTQSMILSVLAVSSLLTFLVSAGLSCVAAILFVIKKQKSNIVTFSVGFICLLIALLLSFIAHVIMLLSRGF